MDEGDKLGAAIREAQRKMDQIPHADTENTQTEDSGLARQGIAFTVTVLGATGLGWYLDSAWGTKPWGLIGMLVLGFAAGFVQVWRALNGYDTGSVGFRSQGTKKRSKDGGV